MMFSRFPRVSQNERGFTLIELVMAFGVFSIIATGIGWATYQVFDVNARSTIHMTAVKEVESAVHWIVRDGEMAQFPANATATGPQPFAAGSPLTLTWVNEFDNNSGNVTYLPNGDRLERTYSANGGPSETSTIAEKIDFSSSSTNWSVVVPQPGVVLLSFKITAAVNGSRPSTETRSFVVIPRSSP